MAAGTSSPAEPGADPVSPGAPVPTDWTSPGIAALAAEVFGAQLGLAQRYAELLTGPGIERGLVGPREPGRIWERHLLNCAALSPLLPPDARVVDVGSGAGLPGLVLAVRRPDLRVDLVESLRRRTDFLTEVVEGLGLGDRVRVIRGRVEDPEVVARVGQAQWVTARALAPLDRLASWCLPLLAPGGRLLAMKGARAESEVREHAVALRRVGGLAPRVVWCPVGTDDAPAGSVGSVAVVVVSRGATRPSRAPAGVRHGESARRRTDPRSGRGTG